MTVKGLAAGRSKAREKPEVKPVPDHVVDVTLPHLPPVVADIARVLRMTGCRVGELLAMTPGQIDRSDPGLWVYRPARHKTSYKGKARVIYIGPRAVEVLSPYLVASGGGPLFRYTRDAVRRAVARVCEAHKIPHWHPHQIRHTAATEIRARFGLEAAQVVLGHAEASVTQVYAEADEAKGRAAIRAVG